MGMRTEDGKYKSLIISMTKFNTDDIVIFRSDDIDLDISATEPDLQWEWGKAN